MMYSNYYFAFPKVCFPKSRCMPTDGLPSWDRPKMNVLQHDDQITLEFAMSGVLKEDVKMSIADRILSIEAHRKEFQDNKNYQHREFGPLKFKSNVRLPERVDLESIHAQFLNGVLKITMNRIKKESIPVDIK